MVHQGSTVWHEPQKAAIERNALNFLTCERTSWVGSPPPFKMRLEILMRNNEHQEKRSAPGGSMSNIMRLL